MSMSQTARLVLTGFAYAASVTFALPNDLLINEQWGLNNVPRTIQNTPATLTTTDYSTLGTCDKKPDISAHQYSCAAFTARGLEDIDINAPEGWTLYSPSPTLAQNEVVIALIDTGIDYGHPDLQGKIWLNPGEALGTDNNDNGIDDGCEDNIDGDNNGYLNDCHGINSMVDRINADGSLNPIAGDPIDDEVGHGTNMAGIMAATANNQTANYHGGIAGVAGIESRIRIVTCKSGTFASDVFPLIPGVTIPAVTETAIRGCLNYFLDLKRRSVNIAVINASGGMSKHINIGNFMYPLVRDTYLLNTPAMYQLADELEQADIVVVAAAGNFSWSIDIVPEERAYFPAAFGNENIIAVGAINNQGNLWSGTSYGRWSVDLFAPGESILSTSPRYPLMDAANADFVVSDGSSQATAYVSGIVALVRANASTAHLDAKSIRRLLLASGKPSVAAQDKSVAGALVRLADTNGLGALTCNDRVFRRRQQPQADNMVALPGESLQIELQNFNCAAPGSDTQLQVQIMPTGDNITLLDDGMGADRIAGDGIYSARWVVPYGHFNYELNSGWDSVTQQDDVLKIQASIVVDNDSSQTDYVGKWWPSIYRSGYYGGSYRYATNADPEKIYTWSPYVNKAGFYRAYARWPQGPNFASNATYRVLHQDPVSGVTLSNSVIMNQQQNGNHWMDLGVYWFAAGPATIELTNVNTNGTCVADAVQLVPEP